MNAATRKWYDRSIQYQALKRKGKAFCDRFMDKWRRPWKLERMMR